MKKLFCIGLMLCVCFLCCPIHAAAQQYNWYCMRNKAYRQPPCAPELAFIEDYNGYYIDHAHGDGDSEKVVYLTFDAGYENGNVEKILNTLKEAQVPGAFFVLKHFLQKNGDLVARMLGEGHTVCNHTANHPNLSEASAEKIKAELSELEEIFKEQTGMDMPKYFRPPEGSFSRSMMKTVCELGYKTVFWSFAYADWDNARQPSMQKAMQIIMGNIHNGAVLLLHPTSATNAEVLPRVIAELKGQGYRFGTLEELCAAR